MALKHQRSVGRRSRRSRKSPANLARAVATAVNERLADCADDLAARLLAIGHKRPRAGMSPKQSASTTMLCCVWTSEGCRRDRVDTSAIIAIARDGDDAAAYADALANAGSADCLRQLPECGCP